MKTEKRTEKKNRYFSFDYFNSQGLIVTKKVVNSNNNNN